MSELKRTPLFDLYKEYGGKTIDFGGWELPVQFSGIKAEHEAVRTNAGLFDVSHMGEFTVKGRDALAFLQKIMTNDVSKLKVGKAQYTAMCYENGGTIDDLLIYKKGDEEFLLVVNASNIEKDFGWLQDHLDPDVELENISSEIALLALQGPAAESILQTLTDFDLSQITFFAFRDKVLLSGVEAMVSRTGYTGEDGFEIYCSSDDAPIIWRAILEAGQEKGVMPCGLGARDTLRFETTLPLYGQELSKTISPVEAGIGFAVKTDIEAPFIGKDVLKGQKAGHITRKLVGIEMIGRGIARHGYPVFVEDTQIGEVTTGTQSPTLNKNIGLALLNLSYIEVGTTVYVEIRGKKIEAQVVQTPFYKRTKR